MFAACCSLARAGKSEIEIIDRVVSSRLGVELADYVCEVELDRIDAGVAEPRDLGVPHSVADEVEHLPLGRSEDIGMGRPPPRLAHLTILARVRPDLPSPGARTTSAAKPGRAGQECVAEAGGNGRNDRASRGFCPRIRLAP